MVTYWSVWFFLPSSLRLLQKPQRFSHNSWLITFYNPDLCRGHSRCCKSRLDLPRAHSEENVTKRNPLPTRPASRRRPMVHPWLADPTNSLLIMFPFLRNDDPPKLNRVLKAELERVRNVPGVQLTVSTTLPSIPYTAQLTSSRSRPKGQGAGLARDQTWFNVSNVG